MIKFRCLNCGQKLAVSEDGVGAVVSCTNCTEHIVVPPFSVTAFFPAEPTRLSGTRVAGGMELIHPAREREGVPTVVRPSLIPHLARMMVNRLVQALFAQRESLIDTQEEATKRMSDLEERIARAQMNVRKKIMAYEGRIAELERQLAAKEQENDDLLHTNFQLSRKVREAENVPQSSRVNLREAGFLLRA